MSLKGDTSEKVDETQVDAKSIVNETPSTVIDETTVEQKDAGLREWLQVLGGFILNFNLWGYSFCFGSFQNYYELNYLIGTSAAAISWIGSIQSFLVISSGVLTGPLFDMGYFQSLMYSGACLSVFGSMMLSICTRYWQIILTQGVCAGLGCGVLFVPTMALVARSFQKKRALAVGAMTCGAPIGAMIYSFMFESLINKIGFAWTARCMSFFMLSAYVVSFPLLLWRTTNTGRIGSATKRKLFDKEAFSDLPFWSYALCVSTQFMAYLTPFFYIPVYAQSHLGTTQSFASYCLIISQAASVPGRIAAALSAHRFGVMITWVTCALVSSIMCLSWAGVNSVGSFIAFAALYGCFSGPLVPLPPSVFPVVCQDSRIIGTRLGMAQGISSIANMIGPPIAGAILRSSKNKQNWLGVQLWSGLLLLFAVIQLCGLWVLLVRKRGAPLFV